MSVPCDTSFDNTADATNRATTESGVADPNLVLPPRALIGLSHVESHTMNRSTKNRLLLAAAFVLLLIFFSEGLAFSFANSQTFDEIDHLAAGYSYLMKGNFRYFMDHPPFIREISALPVYLRYRLPFNSTSTSAEDFLYASPAPAHSMLNLARLPNLVLGTILVGLVGLWAFRLWGKGAGLLAMALAAFEPNLIAHASLLTTDLGATFFTFLTLYLLWEYTRHSSSCVLMGLGVSMGLALASKYSTVIVPAIVALILVGHAFLSSVVLLPGWDHQCQALPLRWRLLAAGFTILLSCMLASVVVSLVYAGDDLTIWFDGLQLVFEHNKRGHPSFFLGQYSRDGWWAYFPAAFVLKTPLGTLALILVSFLFIRAGSPWSLRQASFVILPVVVWFLAACTSRIDIGLRHILPVYPFLFVAAGRLATVRLRRMWLVPLLLSLAFVGTAASSLYVAPHQLAFFNELIGGPEEGYRYLSDSNLDWGQDLKGLKAYMDREGLPMIYLSYFGSAPPAAYGIRYQYLPGYSTFKASSDNLPNYSQREVLAISVLNLQGILLTDHRLYHWLYERTPVAKIGWSIFVYDLTHDADAHLHLHRIYANENRLDLASREIRRVRPPPK